MNKIFQKITSLVTGCVMGVSAISLPVLANETDNEPMEIVFSESFDSYATNAEVDVFDVTGAACFVEEYESGEKGLLMDLSEGAREIGIGVNLEGSFFVSFDISATAAVSGGLGGKNDSGSFSLLEIRKGKLLTHNGFDVSGISGKLKNVTVAANTSTSTYDIYVDGNLVISNYYMSGMKGMLVESLLLSLYSEKGAVVTIDNINIAYGTPKKLSSKKINTEYPEDEFNPEVTEKIDSSKLISDDVYLKQDFSTQKFDAVYNGKDNRLERVAEEDGTAYCQFERIGTQDFHLDINIASYPSASIIYQFDVFAEVNDIQFNSDFKSSSGVFFTMFSVSGLNVSAKGNSKTLEVGKWHTLSVVLNKSENKYSVWVDCELLADDMDVPDGYKEMEAYIWRIHAIGSAGTDRFKIDNIAIYGGEEPIKDVGNVDVVIDEKSTTFEKDGAQRKFLKDKVSYHLRSGVLYADGKKHIYEPLIENGVSFVPLEFFALAFGCATSFDAQSQSGTIDNMTFTADSDSYIKDGNAYSMKSSAKMIDGILYAPLRDVVVGAMGKKIYVDNSTYSSGMVLISDDPITIGKGVDVEKLNNFALYRRPETDDVLDRYKASDLYGKHPRVMADSSDFERIRNLRQTDPQMKAWVNSMIGAADALCDDKTKLVYELRDGVRLLYVSRDLESHMRTLGIAYQVTGDKKYAERAWLDMEAVSSFHTWHPEHAIDVGEMAAGFAIGYDWMYDAYTPEQRKIMEEGALSNGIIEYVENYQGRLGRLAITNADNFNMINNAGAAMLGVAMLDAYPESGAYLISGSCRGLEYAIGGYIPNGSWFEGLAYAGLTLEFLSQHLCTLDTVFNTTFGLTDTEGVEKIPYFFTNMQSKMGSFGFGDGAGGTVTSEPGCLWLCNHFNDVAAASTYKEILGISGDWRTILWYRPEMFEATELLPLDAVYASEDLFVTRDTWEKAKQNTFAGFKGGAANHGHAHGDIGKFDFFANGVQWTAEAGGVDYNVPGFWNWHGGVGNGPAGNRWQYWGTRGEAHNTLIIDPDSQFEFDPFERATLYRTESKPRGAIAVINSTPVHRGKAIKAERGVMMADERRSLVVRDEVTVSKPCKVYWNMLTAQNAVLSEDGKSVTIYEKGNRENYITLDFICDAPYTLTVDAPKLLPNSPNNEYNKVGTSGYQIRLAVDATSVINITAKLTPSTVENGSDISVYNVPMTQWTIPDGEIPESPHLDSLVIDGVEYNPNTKVVNHYVSQSVTEIPEIIASSVKYDVSIQKAESLDGTTIIVVKDKEDENNRSTYKITFTILKSTGVAGVVERDIVSVTASEEPQAENPVKNVLDRDLSTRWSAENAQHIIVDLGKEVDFDTVVMAFMDGASRNYNIKISVSNDNDSYKMLFNGTSGGVTSDYELFDVGYQKARYVKIEGAGHKGGTWNSWTEIAIAKRK